MCKVAACTTDSSLPSVQHLAQQTLVLYSRCNFKVPGQCLYLQQQVVIGVVFCEADMAAASRLGGGLHAHPRGQPLHACLSCMPLAYLLFSLHSGQHQQWEDFTA